MPMFAKGGGDAPPGPAVAEAGGVGNEEDVAEAEATADESAEPKPEIAGADEDWAKTNAKNREKMKAHWVRKPWKLLMALRIVLKIVQKA